MKILAGALTAVLLLTGCVNTSTANRPLVALRKAPDFTLKNVLGGELRSDDFKGKVVVVDFWATWCVPCKKEIPEYNALRQKFKGQDVEFLGVTFETTENELKDFQKDIKMDYPVVWGTDAVDIAFGGHRGFPTTFLVGKDWKVYRKIMGVAPDKMQMLERDITLLLNKPVEPEKQPAPTPQAKTVVDTK